MKELKARIESHLRREERLKNKKFYMVSSGNIVLDILSNEIFCNREKIKLTKKEYNIIKLLIMNKKVVLSKEKIFDNVWGLNSESYLETITESIKNIRKKL
ncbi:winged helix-turn-helix domain-containing protein, partial [Clostridium perfringens]